MQPRRHWCEPAPPATIVRTTTEKTMRFASFSYCMMISAIALGAVSIYFFIKYWELHIALNNSGMQPDLQHWIRALWLAFASQGLLIALLYGIVANRPHSVSRPVIVLLGLLHLVESILQFGFSGSKVVAALLIITALFVLIGSVLWPKQVVEDPAPATAAPSAPL